MDRLNNPSGFLPGIFGPERVRSPSPLPTTESIEAKTTVQHKFTPHSFNAVEWLPSSIRNEFIAFSGEFVGTFLFLFMAFCGTQVANAPQSSTGDQNTTLANGPNPIQLLFISLAFGCSLAINAWIFFRVSGGLFNPAVTLALFLVGAVPAKRGIVCFIAQMTGAIASAAVVSALLPGPFAVTTALGGGTSVSRGLFIEMFLTAQLVLTILMLAVEKHKSTFLAPIGIGGSLFIAEIAGVYFTGASLNPARSFGPCVANALFPREHWIYWAGPALGSLLAAGFYWLIKGLEFQTVNPGQDFDDLEARAFDPTSDLSRPVVIPNAVVDRTVARDLAILNSGGSGSEAPRPLHSQSPSGPGTPRGRPRGASESAAADKWNRPIPTIPLREKTSTP